MFNMGGGLYYQIIHISDQPPKLASFSISFVGQGSHSPHPYSFTCVFLCPIFATLSPLPSKNDMLLEQTR